MKVRVEIPLQATREYIDDFDENTIPNIGDDFEEKYVVTQKNIDGNICTLIVGSKTDKDGHYI